MNEYFKSRLQDLRNKHKDTGEIEYEYRYRELKRAYEHYVVESSKQAAGQREGRVYDPFSPYL
jgi:hypothetical protein